ncbi:hypothetical protein GCM10028807_22610 [Spirosoma daeguense]
MSDKFADALNKRWCQQTYHSSFISYRSSLIIEKLTKTSSECYDLRQFALRVHWSGYDATWSSGYGGMANWYSRCS